MLNQERKQKHVQIKHLVYNEFLHFDQVYVCELILLVWTYVYKKYVIWVSVWDHAAVNMHLHSFYE